MLGVLKAIWDAISLLFTFAVNMLLSLFTFISMIPTYISYIFTLVSVVPPFAVIFFTAGITLTVVLFMLNRTE